MVPVNHSDTLKGKASQTTINGPQNEESPPTASDIYLPLSDDEDYMLVGPTVF